MRILFHYYYPVPHPGAAWRRIGFFAEYLKDKGHKVAIAGAFSLKSLDKAGLSKWRGIRLINLTPIILVENSFSLIFNAISSVITSILPYVLIRPDVVIISVPPGERILGSFIAAKLFGIKIVIDYRDEWEDSMICIAKSRIYKRSAKSLKNFMTRCYLNSDLVVTVTEPLAHSLSLRGLRNVKVVTNGANCNVFRPHSKNVSRRKIGFDIHDFIIVYSGVVGSYYRLDIVVRALKKVIERGYNVKLLMVGAGADLETVLDLTEQEGLKNNVFYLGARCDELELAEILSACDIGIIPYDSNTLWKNSLPAKALEYFACGLPAIATVYKDSLLGKLIFENGIGMVCDPEDTQALADTVVKVYTDTNLMRDGGSKAVFLIERLFDRRKIAEQFLTLLPERGPKH